MQCIVTFATGVYS